MADRNARFTPSARVRTSRPSEPPTHRIDGDRAAGIYSRAPRGNTSSPSPPLQFSSPPLSAKERSNGTDYGARMRKAVKRAGNGRRRQDTGRESWLEASRPEFEAPEVLGLPIRRCWRFPGTYSQRVIQISKHKGLTLLF